MTERFGQRTVVNILVLGKNKGEMDVLFKSLYDEIDYIALRFSKID